MRSRRCQSRDGYHGYSSQAACIQCICQPGNQLGERLSGWHYCSIACNLVPSCMHPMHLPAREPTRRMTIRLALRFDCMQLGITPRPGSGEAQPDARSSPASIPVRRPSGFRWPRRPPSTVQPRRERVRSDVSSCPYFLLPFSCLIPSCMHPMHLPAEQDYPAGYQMLTCIV